MKAALLEYKNTHYPAEIVEKIETAKIKKAFGIHKLTAAEELKAARKLFRLAELPYGYIIKHTKTDVESIEIPDLTLNKKITGIDISAFSPCHSVKSITVPDSVTVIGDHAFDNCRNLTNINIPSNIEFIGYNAFNKCGMLSYNEFGGAYYLGNENDP